MDTDNRTALSLLTPDQRSEVGIDIENPTVTMTFRFEPGKVPTITTTSPAISAQIIKNLPSGYLHLAATQLDATVTFANSRQGGCTCEVDPFVPMPPIMRLQQNLKPVLDTCLELLEQFITRPPSLTNLDTVLIEHFSAVVRDRLAVNPLWVIPEIWEAQWIEQMPVVEVMTGPSSKAALDIYPPQRLRANFLMPDTDPLSPTLRKVLSLAAATRMPHIQQTVIAMVRPDN